MKGKINKIFAKDGKSLMLTMDFGPQGKTNVDDPGRIIEEACAAGIDVVAATYGLVKHFRNSFGDAAIILRLDAFPTVLAGRQDEIPDVYFDAKTAYDLGVQGILTENYVGRKIGDRIIDVESQKILTRLAKQADDLGIVYVSEIMPYNTSPVVHDPQLKKEIRTIDAMKVACRIAAEMGADCIKAHSPGPEFAEVLKNTYIPVFGICSPEQDDPRLALQIAKDALDAGCAGITVGKYVVNNKNVKGIVAAFKALVHDGATVDEALKLYEE